VQRCSFRGRQRISGIVTLLPVFGIDQQFGSFNASAGYIGISSRGLPFMTFPNGYAGAIPNLRLIRVRPTGQFIGDSARRTL